MPENLRQIIARNVRNLREKAGLTREELAREISKFDKRASRTLSSLAKIESASVLPRIDTMIWLAKALGVTVNDLIAK